MIFCIVSFFSCQKGVIFTYSEKFEELKNISSASSRQIAFSNLSHSEKAKFWRYHISKELKQLNTKQKELVKEIFLKTTSDVFVNNSNENVVFKTIIVPQWLKKAETVFGKQKIVDMFYFIEGMHETVVYASNSNSEIAPVASPLYDESAPNCLCNIGSSFTCLKRSESIGFPSGITITNTYGSCTYTYNNYICNYDSYGCGFMALWSCNGNQCTY